MKGEKVQKACYKGEKEAVQGDEQARGFNKLYKLSKTFLSRVFVSGLYYSSGTQIRSVPRVSQPEV